MVGIREEQLDRGAGGLLLAMGMVEQYLREVSLDAGKPIGRGFGRQMQHGAGV